ncbi:TetR/AcrR family transcriptional regulator [Amycolatopsis rhabdoformis]|uniref:TetR/AcrR family transcriptional regulator n=1 Tax=Amycolatopsis rhabdoformis TaxID=1448059 RepID=A0ABZ1HX23_9PSEU|nr:TetR/AcrR family transcriptional regulator [Amycolatopsis rhabdoformis]WSE25924.1 TetR/AcrR family transcriptional regulator [Amycolatopsis rhabdoformis]
MGRVSRAEADRHRSEVVTAAARLFRERGVGGVSVAELMGEVGLTQGGFYRQFASKEALAGEAAAEAFEQLAAQLRAIPEASVEERRAEMAGSYLSEASRDTPGEGCPATALGGESARDEQGSPLRKSYADGVRSFLDVLAEFDGSSATREDHMATLATLVGGLYLARATAGDPVSEEILEAARRRVVDTSHE